jgi:hypothetical protein
VARALNGAVACRRANSRQPLESCRTLAPPQNCTAATSEKFAVSIMIPTNESNKSTEERQGTCHECCNANVGRPAAAAAAAAAGGCQPVTVRFFSQCYCTQYSEYAVLKTVCPCWDLHALLVTLRHMHGQHALPDEQMQQRPLSGSCPIPDSSDEYSTTNMLVSPPACLYI